MTKNVNKKLIIIHRHEVISNSARRPYDMMTLNPSFTGVVFNYMTPVMYDNLINRENFTFRICPETMHTNPFAFYFTKNFYLVNEFNKLISSFQSAGLIDQTMSKYVDMSLMNVKNKQPPSSLHYKNVRGFFEIMFYGWGLAFVSFVCEIIFKFIKGRLSLK